MIGKNKAIRLRATKKTIEQLEKKSETPHESLSQIIALCFFDDNVAILKSPGQKSKAISHSIQHILLQSAKFYNWSVFTICQRTSDFRIPLKQAWYPPSFDKYPITRIRDIVVSQQPTKDFYIARSELGLIVNC